MEPTGELRPEFSPLVLAYSFRNCYYLKVERYVADKVRGDEDGHVHQRHQEIAPRFAYSE